MRTFPGPTPRFAAGCEEVSLPFAPNARWILRAGGEIVVVGADPASLTFANTEQVAALGVSEVHSLGRFDGAPLLAADIDGSALASLSVPHRRDDLRVLAGMLEPDAFAACGYASQILHWARTNRHCGICGERTTQPSPTLRAMRCALCDHSVWPRIAPCTITLIHHDGLALLVRQPQWPAGRYGLVAGFVEAGESLEDCVRREAYEEVGLLLDEVTYRGSQPWPFPHQLMLGFTARFSGGTLALRDGELEDARWCARDAMPRLPPRLSIARSLLDAWIAGEFDAQARNTRE